MFYIYDLKGACSILCYLLKSHINETSMFVMSPLLENLSYWTLIIGLRIKWLFLNYFQGIKYSDLCWCFPECKDQGKWCLTPSKSPTFSKSLDLPRDLPIFIVDYYFMRFFILGTSFFLLKVLNCFLPTVSVYCTHFPCNIHTWERAKFSSCSWLLLIKDTRMEDELFILKLFKHYLSAISFPPKILRACCINSLT